MVNDKTFSHRPINELFSIIENDLKKFDEEGLVDTGTLVKTVMYCNDKLGIPIREVREVAIPVENYRAKLPIDFEKLYYLSALNCSNSISHHDNRNPFDNNFDSDVIYEAQLDRNSLGCTDNYRVVVNRVSNVTIHEFGSWVQLDVDSNSNKFCHSSCPNMRKKGKYTVSINGDIIETPFRTGTLYIMYIGMMKDADGNILFPFHPMITPYYEWACKEKVIMDAIFNSDINKEDANFLLKTAQAERAKAYIDAWNITLERGYGDYVAAQRKRELGWYNQWFKYFQ